MDLLCEEFNCQNIWSHEIFLAWQKNMRGHKTPRPRACMFLQVQYGPWEPLGSHCCQLPFSSSLVLPVWCVVVWVVPSTCCAPGEDQGIFFRFSGTSLELSPFFSLQAINWTMNTSLSASGNRAVVVDAGEEDEGILLPPVISFPGETASSHWHLTVQGTRNLTPFPFSVRFKL